MQPASGNSTTIVCGALVCGHGPNSAHVAIALSTSSSYTASPQDAPNAR